MFAVSDAQSLLSAMTGGLVAACLCASPVLALAAMDVDESRPLRRTLNWLAGALLAAAVVMAILA